ncbi:hypothetical protein Sjap_015767 [Stephania japonica]|uniref:NAC domain-containing protein n=1 Tax=Stephania japonica TaxID=461633 RepID=A0AAP0IKJ6_9MAGN
MDNIPGFGCRFHPTDEELITHYLSKKVSDGNFNARAIGESKKLGRDCTSLELYLHVHTKKHDGQTFIDARSERVNLYSEDARGNVTVSREAGDDPHVDETDLYYKVIGVDHKGRVYRLGSTGRRYNDPGASSSQGLSSQDFATLQSNVSCLTSIVEDQQNQIQTQHEQIALLQSMLMQSLRGGHPGASSSHPPPPRPYHQETLTPPTAVPTPALDANDVYRPRMYEPEDEEEMNLPLQQEWIDALSDTHPLPRPDRDKKCPFEIRREGFDEGFLFRQSKSGKWIVVSTHRILK